MSTKDAKGAASQEIELVIEQLDGENWAVHVNKMTHTAGAGFAGEALINTNNRTAEDRKGLLQDQDGSAYKWTPESRP